jgi:hypothetical protein
MCCPQVHDRTLYTNIHRALVNTLRPSPWLTGGFDVASVSSDGTVKVFDIETGEHGMLCYAFWAFRQACATAVMQMKLCLQGFQHGACVGGACAGLPEYAIIWLLGFMAYKLRCVATANATAAAAVAAAGSSQQLANINPGGWVQDCKWNMFYGMDTSQVWGAGEQLLSIVLHVAS